MTPAEAAPLFIRIRKERELDLLLTNLHFNDLLRQVKQGAPGSITRLMDAVEKFVIAAKDMYEEDK